VGKRLERDRVADQVVLPPVLPATVVSPLFLRARETGWPLTLESISLTDRAHEDSLHTIAGKPGHFFSKLIQPGFGGSGS
jgi:hypothetical protein